VRLDDLAKILLDQHSLAKMTERPKAKSDSFNFIDQVVLPFQIAIRIRIFQGIGNRISMFIKKHVQLM